ncbi:MULTISPECIES: hypothetical protein [unclassified Nostoc]|nr:hypothetical protein [Nostoc sp. KVJ20]
MCNKLVNFPGLNSIKYIIPDVETGYDIEQDAERCHSQQLCCCG